MHRERDVRSCRFFEVHLVVQFSDQSVGDLLPDEGGTRSTDATSTGKATGMHTVDDGSVDDDGFT